MLILGAYLLVFGLAIGNFGTGIRHRAKFVVGLIVLAAPLFTKLVLFRGMRRVPNGGGPLIQATSQQS